MKILSMTFIKEAEIPDRTRNTEAMALAKGIADQFAKAPNGSGLRISVSGAKKHFRFSLQKRLQKLGHKVTVRQIDDNTIGVKRVTESKR